MDMMEHFIVREERPEEGPSIRAINEAAFGRPDEARLVEQLRIENVIVASLVAVLDSELVGHILFSRMWIQTGHSLVSAAALAPMAVLPRHQRSGIGGEMIRYGLSLLREKGEGIVIVLGHPSYYPRFGFSCEKARDLESPFRAEAFMALELKQGALDNVKGRVEYPASFGL
jgi:putative acetyltransferase